MMLGPTKRERADDLRSGDDTRSAITDRLYSDRVVLLRIQVRQLMVDVQTIDGRNLPFRWFRGSLTGQDFNGLSE